MRSSSSLCIVLAAYLVPDAASFTPNHLRQMSPPAHINHPSDVSAITPPSRASTALSMAGFGGGASSKKAKKKGGGAKIPKLNAKAQWDRFADLKGCEKITCGVRLRGEDEWMTVGRVRSEGDAYPDAAVARQRALIADHSKRLYPVQIPANAVLEWGRLEGEEWVLVDKKAGDEAPSGLEKKMGFEGTPDKATGFYCYYHEGRIVDREAQEGKGKPTRAV